MNTHLDASKNHPQEPDDDIFSLLDTAERTKIWNRLLEKAAKQPPLETEPLSDFDHTFQEAVPAKLEGYIRLGATMVAQGLEDFSTAHNRVMRIAQKFGATHLSNGAWATLDNWIDQQILACIDEPMPEGAISPTRLRKITGEPR